MSWRPFCCALLTALDRGNHDDHRHRHPPAEPSRREPARQRTAIQGDHPHRLRKPEYRGLAPPGAPRERHRCAGRTQPKPSFLLQRQHVVVIEAAKATPPQNNSAILVASWQSAPISTNARPTIDRDGQWGLNWLMDISKHE